MKSKSANKLERRASFYGGEVRYEMIVYLEGDNDSSPYMLTLTNNSLDLARTDIPTPQMQSLSRHNVKSETRIKTPSWFKGKPNTKEAKKGVKSLSTSCILGITSSESTGYDVLPYKMIVYHLSAGKIPSLSSKVEIMESYFFFNSHSDSQNLKLELGIPEFKALWLILINPAGGKGQAKIYYEKAKPILESAGIEIVLHETRYKDDAYTYIQEISKEDFRKIDTIVCCSGDGIIHEIINGFYQRPDYKELVLRIGALPGGSGCALLYNSLKERGLDFTLDNAIYLLLRGEFQSMPIFKYKLEPYHRPGKLYVTSLQLSITSSRLSGRRRLRQRGHQIHGVG